MTDHLITVNRLQQQLGHSVTPKEATWFIMIAIAAVIVLIVKKVIFS